jgi:hypothetical protein
MEKERPTKVLLTMRQFLFLHWLYTRKFSPEFCDLNNTDIMCYNCLNQNHFCKQGVIPGSFFYKKVQRQYSDCKRVLDSLVELKYIAEIQYNGGDYHVFYEITPTGTQFFTNYVQQYWITNSHTVNKKSTDAKFKSEM